VCHPTTYPSDSDALFRNNRDGTFTEVTQKAGVGDESGRGLGVAAADFNGDGLLDLFVANDMQPNFLYYNRGDGTFEDVAMQQNVAFGLSGQALANMGVAPGDYDADGDLDVLVTTFSNEPYTLYRNEGGFFRDVSSENGIADATLPYLGFGTGFLDSANQGTLDLFCANGHVTPYSQRPGDTYAQPNLLLLNNGSGRFTKAVDALPADDVRVHRGAAFGDLNNDGLVDILVTANDGRPTLLRNESKAGRWLMVSLVDAKGCATPIGTRCVATVGGRTLHRLVLGGGSYGGESDHRVHFGLGAADKVDKLEIHWRSGQTQVLTNLPAGQILTIREGIEPAVQAVK
jgi:hypothetical protein